MLLHVKRNVLPTAYTEQEQARSATGASPAVASTRGEQNGWTRLTPLCVCKLLRNTKAQRLKKESPMCHEYTFHRALELTNKISEPLWQSCRVLLCVRALP
ncbi:hypothetical protein PHSY_005167 [Pseudozyma hubeiensis SY62]|uniref:Uncharacterized protein n=1 Tax=Pseudozyma hubeiensis (strain SY62) TaxID=1305764 RepID=R9P886_PSEHS|nr:hypothetical protein PHSY_005167 [Pseudozyma hubeiensis SY62]GAC97581.1 hypothetical protein PHSY_005167 [Pseudozyma hubeiensis SY62]